ncbi:DUF2333 family protein [Teredinibacter haidensis]|uniref:DUF2333 family protein n=1 Tax=Teredinibacter haidensis TaxID=2731755 RepID=UPI000948D39A|nr:DUF2333 family protein [Teredinibacter haidensis]
MFTKISRSAGNMKQLAQTRWQDFKSDLEESNRWFRLVAIGIVVYLLLAMVVGIYWSVEPDFFDVNAAVKKEAPQLQERFVTGATTTAALITVIDTLMDKSGGYLSNDIAPPGAWLDNIPNWEYGVLIQVRDFTKAMREAFSRSQSQSTEDKDLSLAEPRFNFDNRSWLLPPTEKEYREGVKYLRSYLQRLTDEQQSNAQFYTRADNINYWLSTVETRLGSLSQRLSASVGQRRLNTDLAGTAGANQSTSAPSEIEIKTSWFEIDDVFYEARGSAWALIHLLKAIETDFADVLEKKNARVSMQQIIRELEGTQETVYSPMILNGSGFGVLANHSLVMANYISRANAAIIDLRDLLSRG